MNKETTSPAIPSIGKVVKLAKIKETKTKAVEMQSKKLSVAVAFIETELIFFEIERL